MGNKSVRNGRKAVRKGMKKESQATLDYLMSWGWVLMIIVLVLVILYSLGLFQIPSAPTIISGFQGITMQAAQANYTMMVVKLTNNYNQFINITGITVTVGGNSYSSYNCLNNILSTGQSTLCRVSVSISSSSFLSKIQISFAPYQSSIYEVSNGTVSSTLVSGAIPLNSQLTYFVEKGLPYGSAFTVDYNTSTNSTIVSNIKNNVSFNLPFGSYYFSVPAVAYQGCLSLPSPSSGTHSTGVEELILFTSNCTTTFSETGLPSGQTWQVTYNGTTATNSTGSSIYMFVKNVANAAISYTATAKSDSLSCVSYATPSIQLGSSYTFNAWDCTTTFSETGLPSGQSWYATFDGTTLNTVSTGSTTSLTQTDITQVTAYTAEGYSSNLNCYSYVTPSLYQGSYISSSYVFNAWDCTTTFVDNAFSNKPQSAASQWTIKYDGVRASTSSTSAVVVNKDVSQVNVFTFQTPFTEKGILCTGPTASVQMGITYDIGEAWVCDTMIAGNDILSEFPPPTSVLNSLSSYSPDSFQSIVYNPTNNLFYATDPPAHSVVIINDSTDSVIKTISPYSGAYPTGLIYANGYVFVTIANNGGSNTFCANCNSSLDVISGTSFLSTNISIGQDNLYLPTGGYNPDANTLWIPTYIKSGPEISIFHATSSAAYINSLGSPWGSNALWGTGANVAYNPNLHAMYISGQYPASSVTSAHAEIAAYWANNGSCLACTIDMSSVLGSDQIDNIFYIPYRVKNVGHTDFIYAQSFNAASPNGTTVGTLNLSNTGSPSSFSMSSDLAAFYDGAYNSGFAYPWSWYYTLNCPQYKGFLCITSTVLHGTSSANPNSNNVSVTIGNNASAIGGVITGPVTVKFQAINLPSVSWSVIYAGLSETSSSSDIIFAVPSGNTYSYSIQSPICDSGSNTLYSPSVSSGSASAGDIISISFSPSGSC